MALGRLSPFKALEEDVVKEQEPITPSEGPTANPRFGQRGKGGGAFSQLGTTPEPEPGAGELALQGPVKAVGSSVAKGLGKMGLDALFADNTFGRPEDAYQEQRAGERDLSAVPVSQGQNPGLWGSGSPLAPELPNIDLTSPGTTFQTLGTPPMPTGIDPAQAASIMGIEDPEILKTIMDQISGVSNIEGLATTGTSASTGATSGLGELGSTIGSGISDFGSSIGSLASSLGAGAISAGVGALPSFLGKLAGMNDPYGQLGLQAAGMLGGPIAGGALAGSLGLGAGAGVGGGLAGAGAGAAAGMAGLAAAAPAGVIAIPTMVIMAMQMAADKKAMGQLKSRMKGFGIELPNQLQRVQDMGMLGAGIGPDTTPEQAANYFQQLMDTSNNFRESGAENILQSGFSRVSGESRDFTAEFPQGPELYKQLSPYLNAIEGGKLRSLDVMGNANTPLPGSWMNGTTNWDGSWNPTVNGAEDPMRFAYNFATPEFMSALASPGVASRQESYNAGEGGMMERTVYDPFQSNAQFDLKNPYASATAEGQGLPGQYVNSGLYNQMMGLKPGNLESGFNSLFAPYGGFNEAGRGIGLGQPRTGVVAPVSASAPVGAAGNGMTGGAGAPGGGGSPSNLLGSLGFAGLNGPVSELRGPEDPTRL